MASSMSTLLCAEDDSIFDDTELEVTSYQINRRNRHQTLGHNGRDLLPSMSKECLASMMEKEIQFLPKNDYLKSLRLGSVDSGARAMAIDWIVKVCSHFGFGPRSAYLSINYLDRFLSSYELPKDKDWMMQLLAVACLSLAAKMDETEVPLCLDLQVGESKFVFEAKTIQRMEILVLTTLKWRIHSVTPFSYLDHFLHKIIDGVDFTHTMFLRATQLISSTAKGIDFLEFKPSEIAAAVSVFVAQENQTVETDKAVMFVTQYANKEKVLRCTELIHELWCKGSSAGSVLSSSTSPPPQSPIGVLDAACMSYKINGSCVSYTSLGSSATPSENGPAMKRRKTSCTDCSSGIDQER